MPKTRKNKDKMAYLTIEQCKIARAKFKWTQEDLAKRCGLERFAVTSFERNICVATTNLIAMRTALEIGGARFEDDGTVTFTRAPNIEDLTACSVQALYDAYLNCCKQLSEIDSTLPYDGSLWDSTCKQLHRFIHAVAHYQAKTQQDLSIKAETARSYMALFSDDEDRSAPNVEAMLLRSLSQDILAHSRQEQGEPEELAQ